MSVDLGLGFAGFGSSGYGFGTPASVNSTAAKLFIQMDGTQGDCVKLDTETGDYVLTASGEKVGWDSVSQTILLAVRTVLGSCSVPDRGIDLPRGIRTDAIAVKNKNAVKAALKKLTDAGVIEIVDVVTTKVGASGVQIEVSWRRLPSGPIESTVV